jgi:NB-ARC domain/WD domain, G-beta repeat/APAF-1 helical domain
MARSRESLWLWAGASFVAAAAALAGVAGALDASRVHYRLWSSTPMVGAYMAAALAVTCFWGAVRDWPFPFAADRPGHAFPPSPGAPLWLVPPVAGWVDRAELAELVSTLTVHGGGAVALTTGLVGAGGFGKTTLAARACQHRAVQRRFRGGVAWVTVGRDLGGAALAAKIGEVVRTIGGDGSAFTSPEQAGRALAGALAARGHMLLIADDVWTADQLEPFATAGQAGGLLVTTRRPAVLAGSGARPIRVDAVTGVVAGRLLTRDLPTMPGRLERELLGLAGGWPLLLTLVRDRLAEDLRRGGSIGAAAADAAARLQQAGPAALDIQDPGSRQRAVAAAVDYSLDALAAADRDRFYELGIFAEDAEIPLAVVALLWRGTAGLGEEASRELCERLDGLSLASMALAGDMRVMVIHDVIRDFAARRLGGAGSAAAHKVLVRAARRLAGQAEAEMLGGSAQRVAGGGTAWWRLPETAETGYLWQNLTYHLKAAGLKHELDQVCCDLRFAAIRLRRSGPAAVEADLAQSAAPISRRLRRAVAQNGHLLGPVEPPAALITTLTSRLGTVPEVAGQLPALRSDLHAWTAWPRWPLPDQSSDALIRTIADHAGPVHAVAVAPDGTWLATASHDKTVRTWAADGTPRVSLRGHTDRVNSVALAPDGTWLATASDDKTVRIWAADGTPRATLTGHTDRVNSVALAPDGTWLATASDDKTLRTWASAATAGKVSSATALRVGDAVWACTWLPGGTTLCAVGDRGVYLFSLCPPGG